MSAAYLKKITSSGYLAKKVFTILIKKINKAEHLLLKMAYLQMN